MMRLFLSKRDATKKFPLKTGETLRYCCVAYRPNAGARQNSDAMQSEANKILTIFHNPAA
jgi:hypothetical protein